MASSSSRNQWLLPLSLLAALLLLPFFTCADRVFYTYECSSNSSKIKENPTKTDTMLKQLVFSDRQDNSSYVKLDSNFYGLAWCRYDFTSEYCTTCITKAVKKLAERCSHNIMAARLVFDDFCYIRIDSHDFIKKSSLLDLSSGRTMFDETEDLIVEKHRKQYWVSIMGLMDDLEKQIPQKKKWLWKKKVSFKREGSTTYGMGQCLKRIHRDSCETCLKKAVKGINFQCTYRKSCAIIHDFCFLKFVTFKN